MCLRLGQTHGWALRTQIWEVYFRSCNLGMMCCHQLHVFYFHDTQPMANLLMTKHTAVCQRNKETWWLQWTRMYQCLFGVSTLSCCSSTMNYNLPITNPPKCHRCHRFKFWKKSDLMFFCFSIKNETSRSVCAVAMPMDTWGDMLVRHIY